MRNLYEEQEATVRTEHGETESFGIGKGVRQGCILSPSLFNLYAERVMREAGVEDGEEGISIGGRTLNNFRYADDVTLMAEGQDSLRALIERVKEAGEKAGLYLNMKKTKVLTTTNIQKFMIQNEEVEVVKSFGFLGSTIEDEGECQMEIKRRITLGRVAMTGLQRIWKDRGISADTKKRLVKTLVHPIMTYGCETWTMKKKDRDRVNAFENWCWRRLLRIPWTAKRTNASIRKQLDINSLLSDYIAKQKLKYFGHVMRGDGLEKAVMIGMGGGKRGRGRPRMRWLDEIKQLTGLSLQELKEKVRDREAWRSIIMTATEGRNRPDGTR
jgi:hypothetical protein